MSRKIGHNAHTFEPPTGQEEGDYPFKSCIFAPKGGVLTSGSNTCGRVEKFPAPDGQTSVNWLPPKKENGRQVGC